jgi:hypothetical protein
MFIDHRYCFNQLETYLDSGLTRLMSVWAVCTNGDEGNNVSRPSCIGSIRPTDSSFRKCKNRFFTFRENTRSVRSLISSANQSEPPKIGMVIPRPISRSTHLMILVVQGSFLELASRFHRGKQHGR